MCAPIRSKPGRMWEGCGLPLVRWSSVTNRRLANGFGRRLAIRGCRLPDGNAPPRNELTPAHGAQLINIPPAPQAARVVAAEPHHVATILASIAVLFVGLCAFYFLV